MSYYILSNDNFKTFDSEKLVFGDKIISDTITKYYLYYIDNNETKQIYIKLPKLRMIFNNFANQKYSQINIPIYPLWTKTEEFINFILDFEKIICNIFKTKFAFCSLLSNKNSFKLFKMYMKNLPKITSTINKNINFNDFQINSEIELVVKIDSIWLNKSYKMYGLSCRLSQIKYYGNPEQSCIDFIDDRLEHIPRIENIPKPPPLINTNANTQIKKLVPSVQDLENAMKKLKKMKI